MKILSKQLILLLFLICTGTICPAQTSAFVGLLKKSATWVEDAQGKLQSSKNIQVQRQWKGNICKSKIKNTGSAPLRVSNIVLFDLPKHGLKPNAPIYGEGFQMLHQHGGTLAKPINISSYNDEKHYRIPRPHGMPTAYGMLSVSVAPESQLVLGFSSCRKFIGRISYDSLSIQISIDAEGLELKPGETWQLEDFMLLSGNNRGALFDLFAGEIAKNHPQRKTSPIPTGWCSWYCYGPAVTHSIIEENLNLLSKSLPELKYIQLDDGYQPFMGDWLDENPAYGDLQKTLSAIRSKGFEPAIWVAPFIAEKKSRVFREHPDWFVKDSEGNPLNSAKVGFGGWRSGPWYVLDGTHPEVQKHLENVIRTMRQKWGVNYFKLDANYWGAIHNGIHFDKKATRIEAYRRGMEAILKGCDKNTVVLGCNAPIWPSLGLVTAMRTSDDISRKWSAFRKTAFENLSRAWQNGTLWQSDPDCIVLSNDNVFAGKTPLAPNEFLFHATAIHAVGGLMLSGDKASKLGDYELKIVKKLLKPTGRGVRFSDGNMETGITDLGNTQYYYFFNWSEIDTINLSVKLKGKSTLTDYWTDEKIGEFEGSYTVKNMAPRTARLIVATKK